MPGGFSQWRSEKEGSERGGEGESADSQRALADSVCVVPSSALIVAAPILTRAPDAAS
jgi:hypothetical protein